MEPQSLHAGVGARLVPQPVEVVSARRGLLRPDEHATVSTAFREHLHVGNEQRQHRGRHGDQPLTGRALGRLVDPLAAGEFGDSAAHGIEADAAVCVRSRRFVLDDKPVLLSTSYLPADLVAGSAITQEDTGPGGTYARLAELGCKPVHFREEIRSRMPSQEEASRLQLSMGTPVIMICRTAFADEGRPVEVNEMTLDSAAYVLEYDFDA
ncbi:regulatory protein KorSA, GntR-family transcriptional regulator [Streptomyces sp. e14]|nr:regulatory protein KorSA, GntR-family transcriptional regulator [Streptomyces sp. e14]